MVRFQRFKGPNIAVFLLDGKRVELDKKNTIALHDAWKRKSGTKGSCPESEVTKFALDRWPDTALGRRIAQPK